MRRSSTMALVLLLGIGILRVRCGAAQETAPTVIRSTTREVLVDMVVRDRRGRLVTNLKPGDVAVYEDGVLEDVRSFRLVAGKEVRVEDAKEAAAVQAAPVKPTPASPPSPPFNPLRTVNVVCLILNDLNPDTRSFAFDAAFKFVNQELRPNTFIGVFTLDASGLRPVYPFSNNRDDLLKAIGLAAVDQLPSINLSAAAMFNGLSMSASANIAPTSGAPGFADGSSGQDPLGLRGDMGFSVNAGLREIDALTGLVKQLKPLPFQKTVMLLSTGLTRPPDQTEYWDSLIHQALAGGITFYAMDVYGLGVCQGDTNLDCVAHSAMAPAEGMLGYVAGLSAAQTGVRQPQAAGGSSRGGAAQAAAGAASAIADASAVSATAQMAELSHQDDYLRFMVGSANRQEAIRELAERTGGFLIANTNNTDKLLAHVMEEVDTHYEVTYAPLSDKDDGRFRKIEVKLGRPGLRVETRNGYYAVPETGEGPLTSAEMAGLDALDSQPRPHAFDFLLRPYRFRQSAGVAQYAIAFEMPLSNLTAAPPDGNHKRRLHASLLAVVKDAQGQIVDRVSKDVSSDVGADRLAAVQAEVMTYEHAVKLPPGRYTVEAAVLDQEGNRASTSTASIDNREQPGVGLSDIALVRRVTEIDRAPDPADPFEFTGKRLLPFVKTDVAASSEPYFYFVVYPQAGNAAKPRVTVELLKDGHSISRNASPLPPADASGAIPMLMSVPGKPGNYEIRIRTVQAGASAERKLAYTVPGAAGAAL